MSGECTIYDHGRILVLSSAGSEGGSEDDYSLISSRNSARQIQFYKKCQIFRELLVYQVKHDSA